MSRYGTVASTFWDVDAATAGLPALAACLLLRARSESLIGVLQRSPSVLARAHQGETAQTVTAAIAELERRGLARWWPESETLALVGGAGAAKGDASKAAAIMLGALPPDVVAVAQASPGVAPPVAPPVDPVVQPPVEPWVWGGRRPNQQEHDQGREPDQQQRTAAKAVPRSRARKPPAAGEDRLARRTAELRRRYTDQEIEQASRVLALLTSMRRELIGPRCKALHVAEDGDSILRRLRSGATVDELELVVRWEADKVRRGETTDYFDAITPFRDANWPRRRAGAEAWDARRQAARPRRSVDVTPDQIRADLEQRPAPASADELDGVLPPWAREPEPEVDGP